MTIDKLLKERKPESDLTIGDIDIIARHYTDYDNADPEMMAAIEGGVNKIALRVMALDRYAKR